MMPEQVSAAGLVLLLEKLEAERATLEVKLDSDLGVAQIWLQGGRIIDAQMGNTAGQPALFRLLGLSHARVSLVERHIERKVTIGASVRDAMSARARRAANWRDAVASLPPLESVLSINRQKLSQLRPELTVKEAAIVRYAERRLSILEIVESAGPDAVGTAENIASCLRRGVLELSDAPVSPRRRQESVEEESSTERTIPNPFGEPELDWEFPSRPARSQQILGSVVKKPVSVRPAPLSVRGAPETLRPNLQTSEPPADVPTRRFASEPPMPSSHLSHTLPGVVHPGRMLDVQRVQRQAAISQTMPGGIEHFASALEQQRAESQRAPARQRTTSSDPPAPVSANHARLLGRYETVCKIAHGGMGIVYLCRLSGQGGFRRLFALKVLSDALSQNPEYAELFLREARIAAAIHHPNVVGIQDVGVQDGRPYLVMDYVEGCSFQELLLREAERRDPRLIVPIVLGALRGLHQAHILTDDAGRMLHLVHCDVSPHNMLIGVDGTCRISDFGIARARGTNRQSGSDEALGKPAYLSPEQVTGKVVDLRSDIFSMGVVLWNALTGQQLFRARTIDETMENVLHSSIARPSSVGLRPPACFDEICMRALERDPRNRFQKASEMLEALRAVALDRGLLASPDEIGSWVTTAFGPEIERRRGALQTAPKNSDPPPPEPAYATGRAAVSAHAIVDASRKQVVAQETPKLEPQVLRAGPLIIDGSSLGGKDSAASDGESSAMAAAVPPLRAPKPKPARLLGLPLTKTSVAWIVLALALLGLLLGWLWPQLVRHR